MNNEINMLIECKELLEECKKLITSVLPEQELNIILKKTCESLETEIKRNRILYTENIMLKSKLKELNKYPDNLNE